MSLDGLIPAAKFAELRVSSVLNRNSKEYGKQFLTDGSDETCWSSDQGRPQWVAFKWESALRITKIEAKFQGGFCGGRGTTVEGWTEEHKEWDHLESWLLEDVGECQSLTLKKPQNLSRLRILFPSSTDFFGRIIMYKIEIWSEKS